MWSHISPAPRLRRARMAAPARRPRRLRDCAAARATLLLQPSHARACAYGSQLPTSTSNFGFANCYILYSVPTIYKIYFRFQDIGLGYICYVHMNIHRQAKKQRNIFWQLLGDCTYLISFSHHFWTQDIQRTGNLINNQSMHFDLIDEVNHHEFDANYHITLTLFSQIKVAKGHAFSSTQNPCISNVWTMNFSNMNTVPVHRGAFCQIPFRWIYYYGSTKSTGKETGKTNLCAVGWRNVL